MVTSRSLPSLRSYRGLSRLVALALLVAGAASPSGDLPELAEAEALVERHRFREAADLLAAVDPGALSAGERCEVQRALGRARFHLGEYRQSYELLRSAAAQGCPRTRPSDVYLNAVAYLTGRVDEALEGLSATLEAGVTDLYLDVTLPGERAFLGDPAVWQVRDRHAAGLAIPVHGGEGEGAVIALGQTRDEAAAAAPGACRWEGSSLVLEAGPHRVLELSFDDAGALAAVAIDAGALLRYTPYRLDLGGGLGWWSAPDELVEKLGAPASFEPLPEGGVRMRWQIDGASLSVELGAPGPVRPAPIPAGRAMVRRVELSR